MTGHIHGVNVYSASSRVYYKLVTLSTTILLTLCSCDTPARVVFLF